MRIYAVLAILIIIVGSFSFVGSAYVAKAENKSLRKQKAEFEASTVLVASESEKEVAEHKQLYRDSQKQVIALEAEAEQLRLQIPDGDGQLCRPGCIVR